MTNERKPVNSSVTPFSHRTGRILERIDDWGRYIRSPCELFQKYVAGKRSARIMERAEVRKALAVAEKEHGRHESGTRCKYSKIERYIPLNLRRIYALGLHKIPPLTVLDIGAGAGFFMYLCKLHGHEAMGFDANREGFYREMHEALDVPCRHLCVCPETPLPDFGRKFDLITAFAVCFHKTDAGTWSTAEWRFFLNDLLDNHCNNGGRVHLHLNDSPPGDRRDVRMKIAASFPGAAHGYQSVTLRKFVVDARKTYSITI